MGGHVTVYCEREEYAKLVSRKMDRRQLGVERQIADLLRRQKIGERSWNESKKMWEIAGPAILTAVAQFSIGFVTVAFVGHLGGLELAAVSVVQNVIEGFVYGIMEWEVLLRHYVVKLSVLANSTCLESTCKDHSLSL